MYYIARRKSDKQILGENGHNFYKMVVCKVKIFAISLKCLLHNFFPEQKMLRYLKLLIPHCSTCRGARWNWSMVPCSSVLLCGPWHYLDILQPAIANACVPFLSWLQEVASVSTLTHIFLQDNADWDVCFIPGARLLGLLYNVLAPFCRRGMGTKKGGLTTTLPICLNRFYLHHR